MSPTDPPPERGEDAAGAPAAARFRFGDVEVDVRAMRVVRGGEPVELEPKIFDLLVFLAGNPGRVIGKDEILERVWQGAFVTDNALARAVAQLRRALGDDAAHARYLETVRTRGYRFVARLEAVPAVAAVPEPATGPVVPSTAAASPAAPPAAAHPSRIAGRVVAIALAVLVLVVVTLVGDQLLRAARVGKAARSRIGAPQQLTVSPGYDGGPTFSPDGTYVAFSSERGGAEPSPEIVVRRLDDGEELRLTSDGAGNVQPAWSPDGRSIAYHSMARGGLWLVSPLGGSPRRLTELGSQPAWSPDARSVVFCSQNTTALAPWSWAASREALLWVVDVASGDLRQLTRAGSPAGGHGEPAWSPGGSTIAFTAGDQMGQSSLWRVAVAGGEPEELESAVNASLGDAAGAEVVDWRAPVFVDEDEVLAVRSSRSQAVWRLPVWGREGADELLPVAPEGTGDLALSPGGERLAFADYTAAGRIAAVTFGQGGEVGSVVEIAAAARRLAHPLFSPDGSRLSYSRARGGQVPDLIVVGLGDEGAAASSALELQGLLSIGWSSDTRLLAFAKGRHVPLQGDSQAVEIDVESGQRRVLAPPAEWFVAGGRYQPSFWHLTPRLDRVVFGARSERAPEALELFWASTEAPEPRQLTQLGAISEFPSWSTDGRLLVFQVSQPATPGQDELWVVEVAGDEPPRRVLQARGRSWGARFDPTDERVVYAAQRDGRWDLAVVAEGEPERLLGVNRGYTAYVRWPDWSPSGDRIAFEHTQMTADVWILPLRPAGPAAAGS